MVDGVLEQARDALDAGDIPRALALSQAAVVAAGADKAAGAEAARLLALSLLHGGRGEDARKAAKDALRLGRAAASLRAQALAELAIAEIDRLRGDTLGGLKHAGRARALGARANDPDVDATVLADFALFLSRVGDDERAREAFEELLAGPVKRLPARQQLRVFCNAAINHRAAGRFALALAALGHADALAPSNPAEQWSVAAVRMLTLLELGALDEARALLEGFDTKPIVQGSQRAQVLALKAAVALGSGARSERVESLVEEGLAIEGIEAPLKFGLERIRALGLMLRGRFQEAERVAIGLTSGGARGGTRAHAAQALAIAARAGAPEAWLQRWLGALACAADGAAARIEHEAYAALVAEPDPIGLLARNAMATLRTRLVDRAPPRYKKRLLKLLKQVEARTTMLRKTRRDEAALAVNDDVLRAKEEVGLAGSSPILMRAIATTARAAKSNASLVFSGETGSGKELFANLAHRLSPRAKAPFVAVNCAAIPHPLLEAELFGHERGAFTGAERARRGLFVEGDGGTVFLDEVGEMSPAMQAKLLRVLEGGEVRAVGGQSARKVDVRVIAATHRDLAEMVSQGTFREDLYYRLAAITVRIPALRERPEDLPAVARALLAREPDTKDHRLDVPALTLLAEHGWPGNVRELANALRVAAAMASTPLIGRPELATAIGASPRVKQRMSDVPAPPSAPKETTLAALRERHRAEVRELVTRAIETANGNKLKAAKSLGVSRQGLYRVLEE